MPKSHTRSAVAAALQELAPPPPSAPSTAVLAPPGLAEVMPPAKYRPPRQHAFPSDGSLQWYIRRHRAALAKAGAIVVIAGRLHIHASRFDDFVLRTGAAEATEAAGRRA